MSLIDIIAVGARTPVGFTAESSAAAVRAGISSFFEYPFISPTGEPVIVAADPDLTADHSIRDRLFTMAESVIEEVKNKLDPGILKNGTCNILLALPEIRPGFCEKDANWLVGALQKQFDDIAINTQVAIAGRGHAGAVQAVTLAVQKSSNSPDDLFLIIGVDSYHCGDTFIHLEHNLQFKQPLIRSGFIPGEAAGCIALVSNAQKRGKNALPVLATIEGVGTGQESLLRDSDTGSFGVGMTMAVEMATQTLALPAEGVDTLYSDINGERYRSEEWGFVAIRTPNLWKSLNYEAPGDCWGDVGAAFPPLAAVLAVQSYMRNYSNGPRSLVIAGSEGGLRGALLLQNPKIN